MFRNGRTSSVQSVFVAVFIALSLVGCGTTRSSDSMRTATEQLLISDAIDRAVQAIDFNPLAGQTVYVDDSRLKDVVDKDYLVSTLRQQMLASGCTLRDDRENADFIVEARAGAVGTDRNDLLFGIPATNVPQILPFQGVPAAIPEVPLAKRRDQRGVAKISMFAYHRVSGRPVWQSGMAARESSSNDVWFFGAGPFQYGSILQASNQNAKSSQEGKKVGVAQRAMFASPEKLVQQYRRLPAPEIASARPQDVGATSDAIATKPAAIADPEPYRPAEIDTKSILRGLAEAATPKPVEPRLTGQITEIELMRNAAPKTVEISRPSQDTDPIALPQPRFDPL